MTRNDAWLLAFASSGSVLNAFHAGVAYQSEQWVWFGVTATLALVLGVVKGWKLQALLQKGHS